MFRKKVTITKKRTSTTNTLSKPMKVKDHQYTKYFPSILDPNFTNNITNHKLFRKYKLTINKKRLEDLYTAFETNTKLPDDTKRSANNFYILKLQQKLLRNFMSPYTPYRNLLIYHQMGVGKTCTAITIAEQLKTITQNSDTKIYVIRPDEIERQIFNINVIRDGRPLNQCTGDTYFSNPKYEDYVSRCMTKDETSCESLKLRATRDIRKIYEFTGAQAWAKKIDKEIELKTASITDPNLKEDKIRQIISARFDNAVIIIDEAHELHDNPDKESKLVPPILNIVLKHATNLRLIFLTATPIYDKPQNIISLINYFLLNDKRPTIKESDVFDVDGNLKPNGRDILIANTRGYVTYLRGTNPFEFPLRLSAKYNIPNDIFNLRRYPSRDINGDKLEPGDTIKHLELVGIPLKNQQLELMNYHVKYEGVAEISERDFDTVSYAIPAMEPIDVDPQEDQTNLTTTTTSKAKTTFLADRISHSSTSHHSHQSHHSSKSKRLSGNPDTLDTVPADEEDQYREQSVARQFESQLSNFVYLSLEECNKNTKLAIGESGLKQIATKQSGKYTYEFNDPKYAKRFKLPELYNWGAKLAKVVEMAIKSNGPIFVYTYFNYSGIIPLAFALEMNGFKRYKQWGSPLIESQEKDPNYKGDYIIYTGDQRMSLFAKDYLDKQSKMVDEKNVKVFIGTSKASEGLNLFGYREVHIIDPWHNINLIEQSIGRVIRTGSHLHLPPQDRNVTVYQYVTTLDDRESVDLKIYKICENKAIKAGVVEKILMENAFDCELNKEVNEYDDKTYNRKIRVKTSHGNLIETSLADAEYSRNCFYMKDCSFTCTTGKSHPSHPSHPSHATQQSLDIPVMKFNIEKEIEEYKNLIIQLIATSPNIKIDNLRQYLKRMIYGETKPRIHLTKKRTSSMTTTHTQIKHHPQPLQQQQTSTIEWEDEESFMAAIQELVNGNIEVKDKFGRKGTIAISGDYLRFIPEGNNKPNLAIQKQYLMDQKLKSQVDLKMYINQLTDEQKRLLEEEELNYEDILNKFIQKCEQMYYGLFGREWRFNVKVKMEEVIELMFAKEIYTLKLTIIKNILEKIVVGTRLTENEKKVEDIVKKHLVYLKDVFPDTKHEHDIKKNIYGFIIENEESKLELYILNESNQFEKNLGNLKKIIENFKAKLAKIPHSKMYGYLKYEKPNDGPTFKIADVVVVKGDKSPMRGATCIYKRINDIKKNLNKLDDRILKAKNVLDNKNALCNDVEILLKRFDTMRQDNRKWYYTPEEYHIYFGDQG